MPTDQRENGQTLSDDEAALLLSRRKFLAALSIGLGNKANPAAGGSGVLYVDDIRLYRD